MSARFAVHRHKQRIDAAITRMQAIPLDWDGELKADLAKYLCVIVSGYLEKSVSELLIEHARKSGAPSLLRYVEKTTSRFANANSEKILTIVDQFDSNWHSRMQAVLVDEVKAAVDSVVANRHQIAHGGSVGLTLARMVAYYELVQGVIEELADMCEPV